MTRRGRHIATWVVAGLTLLMGATACSTSKGTTTARARHKHEKTERKRNKDDKNKPRKVGKHSGKHGGHGVSEEWAALAIPLGRHDNKELYNELKRWLGTPYLHAASKCGEGTDCSGMVMEVYRTVYGIPIERNSARIYERNCEPIGRDDLREGDLVFFDTNGRGGISHVGIYLKENKFVHTSSSRGVMVSDLNQRYWDEHYHSAGRVRKK